MEINLKKSKNIERKNSLLVFGFISLNLFIFSSSFEVVLDIPKTIKYIFSVIALYIFFIFYKKSPKVKFESGFMYIIYNLFLFISIFLLIRSVRFDVFFIQEFFAERFFYLPYLLPLLFLFVRYDLYFFKRILKFSYFLIPIAIFAEFLIILFYLDLSNYTYIATGISTLCLVPALLLFVSHLYKKSKYTRLTIIFFLLLIFITAILGRRGETIESIFFLFWALLIRLTSGGIRSNRRKIILIFSLLFISVFSSLVVSNYENIYLFERGFSKEGFEESRGETIDNFIATFGTQSNDFLIGRGLNGTFQKFSSGDNQISRSIEIGYLNILLKGGFLYLLPMMLLFIIAFYKGYFKSNNDLSKGLAGLVLWQIIYMISFGMANFATTYLFIWIAVTVCIDPRIRKISNSEIKKMLNA